MTLGKNRVILGKDHVNRGKNHVITREESCDPK